MNSESLKIPKSEYYERLPIMNGFNHSVFGDIPIHDQNGNFLDVVGSYQSKVIDVLGEPIDLGKNEIKKLKEWCLSKGLFNSGKCKYIPDDYKEESFWIISDSTLGFHISSKSSNLYINIISFEDYYYIVSISRKEININTKGFYMNDYVYKCDQPEGLFKLLNNLSFKVKKKEWYKNILNFESFKR